MPLFREKIGNFFFYKSNQNKTKTPLSWVFSWNLPEINANYEIILFLTGNPRFHLLCYPFTSVEEGDGQVMKDVLSNKKSLAMSYKESRFYHSVQETLEEIIKLHTNQEANTTIATGLEYPTGFFTQVLLHFVYIHWASKETYLILRAMLTEIHRTKINHRWIHISYSNPTKLIKKNKRVVRVKRGKTNK